MRENIEEKIQENLSLSGNALDYLRKVEERGEGAGLIYWKRNILEEALLKSAELMPAISHLGHLWHEAHEMNRSLSPVFELEESVRKSGVWTEEDLQNFEKHLATARRSERKKLLNETAEIIEKQLISSEDDFAKSWIKLLLESVKELRRLERPVIVLVHPESVDLYKWVLSILNAYCDITWAMEKTIRDKVSFLKRRYKAFMRIKGKLIGPPDMAETHNEAELD